MQRGCISQLLIRCGMRGYKLMLTNADCTIYHKTYDPQTRLDVWNPTQWKDVNWYATRAVSVGDNGLNGANTLVVEIPTYGEIKEFPARVGDIVVKGLWEGIVSSTKEIPIENRYTITAIQDNRCGSPAIQHWRLEGA